MKNSPIWILMILLLAGGAIAQDTDSITYTWTAPVEGSAVVTYVVQLQIDGGTWTAVAMTIDPRYTLTYQVGTAVSIRTAGLDASGRQGPYSLPSDPFLDAGAPGAPGQPVPVGEEGP